MAAPISKGNPMASPYQTETVKVACEPYKGNEQGFYIINKADFDAKLHKLWNGVVKDVKVVEAKVEKVAEEVKAEVEKVVEKAEAAAGWGKAPPPSA